MTVSKRDNGEEFYHFSDNAPQEIKDIFREEYEIRDLDYEIFSRAIDTFSEYTIEDIENDDFSVEFASYYTSDRLGYLNIWNQDEVTELVKTYDVDIQDACAIWYDQSVERAMRIILNEYINA